MDTNPYQSPELDPEKHPLDAEVPACPECGQAMERGYITTGAAVYWRNWQDRRWLVFWAKKLPGTGPAFIGTNKLGGFRCPECELVLFRYGRHRQSP